MKPDDRYWVFYVREFYGLKYHNFQGLIAYTSVVMGQTYIVKLLRINKEKLPKGTK